MANGALSVKGAERVLRKLAEHIAREDAAALLDDLVRSYPKEHEPDFTQPNHLRFAGRQFHHWWSRNQKWRRRAPTLVAAAMAHQLAHDLDPSMPEDLVLAGYCYESLGDSSRADEMLTRALSERDNSSWYLSRGLVRKKAGDRKRALADFIAGAELALQSNEKRNATACLREARSIDQKNQKIQRLAKRLRGNR